VLVADVPEAHARLAAALNGAELRFAQTLGEALRALREEDFELLLAGVHFDESRMFDLLRAVRSGRRNHQVPIVCIRTRRNAFATLTPNALEVTIKALNANAYVDLSGFADDERGNAAVRQLLETVTASFSAPTSGGTP
jgi:DNA-binding response OmpR family regulator